MKNLDTRLWLAHHIFFVILNNGEAEPQAFFRLNRLIRICVFFSFFGLMFGLEEARAQFMVSLAVFSVKVGNRVGKSFEGKN
jgi:hypothetical protein